MKNYIYNTWRATLHKISGDKLLLAALLSTATLSISLTSCVTDNEANSSSIYDIKDSDVRSYGDLFHVFWSVMNQRYCDFNEQTGDIALNWDEVYKNYKPQFDALKSFNCSPDYSQGDILADNAKAKQYFQEITDKILDQHFYVNVTLPVSHSSFETVQFRSNLYERENPFPLNYHWDYTKELLDNDRRFGWADGNFSIMGGFLKDQPDTYYLGFTNFALVKNCYYDYYKMDYLPTYPENPYHLGEQEISSHAQELVANPENLSQIESQAQRLLARINNYLSSDDVKKACSKMTAYKCGGKYEDLVDLAKNAAAQAPDLIKNMPIDGITEDSAPIGNMFYNLLSQEDDCPTINSEEEEAFKDWFSNALANYLWHERELCSYLKDLNFTVQHPAVEDYHRKFLAPLIKGDIKKLIIDLRSNGGGDVIDTRLLTDYLVSHTATYAYMRKKEDNDPYGYTPWVPQQIILTERSLKRDIPTAILLDNYSGSMSEMTSLVLKSQGDHVKTIGRNSAGAQSMLMGSKNNNGGWQGNVTSYLYFEIPVCQTKDAQGNMLEAKGITPDYVLEPMTQDEINSIKRNEDNAIDRGMQKALEILK